MASLRTSISGLALIWALSLAAALPAGAQTAKEVEGTWSLVSVTVAEGDKKRDLFGDKPRGQLMLGSDNRFAIIYTRSDIPKFQANNRNRGTAEENQSVVQGSVAHFGSYTVENGDLVLKVEGSTFPNWVGETQHRKLKLSGDELTFETPIAKNSGAPTVITWKRSK